ncbi:MAG: DUF5666 domain-containing protein [Planctomycetota bacterium]
MVRNFILALIMPLVMVIAGVVRADDGGDLEIAIKAPVQAVDTVAGTITVLGLVINVPATAFTVGGEHHGGGHHSAIKARHEGESGGGGNTGGGDNSGGDDGDDDNDGDPTNTTPLTLDTLIVGQFIEIKMSTDVAPLTAVEVSDAGGYTVNPKIHGTIQAVDTVANTVTVLGATIDISTATIDGCNDDDSETVATDAIVLAVGQSVSITLDPAQLPLLVATSVNVKNFTNQIDVELEDNHGNHVGDDDTEDTTVDVTQSVKVVNTVTGKISKKTVHIRTKTRTGKISLAGLAPGKAKLVITRKGKSYRKMVTIAANGTSSIKVKVK